MIGAATELLARAGVLPPYRVEALEDPAAAAALFARSFGAPPPSYPHHFVARTRKGGDIAGYIHFTEQGPGVFLCGGLCVDRSSYRALSLPQRDYLRKRGSLSRWLLAESIARLPGKRAVFAFTGNVASARDGMACGFEPTAHEHLIVQWHAQPLERRGELVAEIARLGPF